MDEKEVTLQLTKKEVTMIFYMAGYSCNEVSKAYTQEYASFMRKLSNLSLEG